MINFALTAMVGFGAVLWLDPRFAIFVFVGMFFVAAPLYAMNKGVLKKVPIMEKTMRQSQKKIAAIFSGDGTKANMFSKDGEFSNSLKIMGHLMTVRYRAGVIKSVFMSACLIAVGIYIITADDIDYGIVIPLLVALKLFAGSLQGMTQMSVGVSRTLVDAIPALYSRVPPKNPPTSSLSWPLYVELLGKDRLISLDETVQFFSKGLQKGIATALVCSRMKNDNGSPVDLSLFTVTEQGVDYKDKEGNTFSLQLADKVADASLLVTRREITIISKDDIVGDSTGETEREIEMELDIG
ncbi:MAG TPA: hypothetical protein EYO40_05815 [Phycisphaerales bacterium]|nr:hypothetical protein [Phycisphaerales bacterium]